MTPDACDFDCPRQETSVYRVAMPAGMEAGSRVALVKDLDGPWIGELTLRGQVGWRYFSAGLELGGVAGTSEVWSSADIGNVAVDLHFLMGREVTHALGMRGILPTGAASTWGTVPEATVATAGAAFTYDGASERLVWHLHTGFRFNPTSDIINPLSVLDAGIGLGVVQPIVGPFSVMGEVEARADYFSPLHLRVLGRADLDGGWQVDAGLALSEAIVSDPSLDVVLGVRHRW